METQPKSDIYVNDVNFQIIQEGINYYLLKKILYNIQYTKICK